ncbi:HNH endonuclease [Kosakonia sp. BK9b]|uniref:hypothetical protein n=1 Tax=Kosakonia sp. TaxID=1916651 RepID=UPI00289B4F4D|nr:hypothetical protein [Kosakonia sp.]
MIKIDRSAFDEPDNFDEKCRQKGAQWLLDHPKASRPKGNRRPKDFWSPFKGALATASKDLCAYGAMYEPAGTVDHFDSVDNNESLAYEWTNYRFSSGWINSSKNKATTILDPFIVEDGWFEILLPSLQLVTVPANIPEQYKQIAEATLTRLHLRDDERVIRQRRKWLAMFQSNKLTLDGLHEMAPLIARAVEKQRQQQQLAQTVEIPAEEGG